jgi:hypothetical protein
MRTVVGVGLLLLLLTYFVWYFKRSKKLLFTWADSQGLKIIRFEMRSFWFLRGPYSLSSEKWQTVYRVVVENSEGFQKSAWVRLGDSIFGVLVGKVDVTWEKNSSGWTKKKTIVVGSPCVRCEETIEQGEKLCPFCGWTQP